MSDEINKNDSPATPEQLQYIEEKIGEPIESFVKKMSDESHRRNFANTLSRTLQRVDLLTRQSSSNGKYQPIYSEETLQQVNVNPVSASSDDINRWLLNPQNYDQNVRHLSQYLSYSVGQYNRALWYLNGLKSYKYRTKYPYINRETLRSKKYKDDYETYLKFLQKSNLKYNMAKVDLLTMYDGISCWYLQETNDSFAMFNIPIDYCYLTAPWDYGFRFCVDLSYFDRFAKLQSHVPELIQAYKLFVEKRNALYNRSSDFKKAKEELAPFQYYPVPPEKGWTFTFDPIHADKLPPLTSSMATSLDILSYRELLKNKLALDLYKIIALKIPLDKESKKMAITYGLAEEITQVIQSTLPDNVKVYSSPFESTSIATDQTNRFDEIINISNNGFSSSTGFNQGLFGSNQAKQGTAIQLSAKVDFAYASLHMYTQYDNFVNYQVAIRTKKHKFGVKFFGSELEREKEEERATNKFRTANTPAMDYFSEIGYEPFEVGTVLAMEEEFGYKEKMMPLVSAFNSKQEGEGGKPKKNVSDLTDGGANTRDYGQSQSKQMFSQEKDKCIHCGRELDFNSNIKYFCDEVCKEDYALEIINGVE